MEEGKGIVCVTGGTGFVASWLIMRLLQRGYSIRATIRTNPKDGKRDISYLTNLPGAAERLEMVEADLDRPESFDAAIKGCAGVFHLAHPMDVDGREPEEAVTRRAVEGTLGILKACLKSPNTVKRVVYASSAVAVLYNSALGAGGGIADEATWSDLDVCRSSNIVSPNYLVSKTVVERTALEFAESHGLELVTIVLPLVVGPFICPNIPSSVYMPLAIIFGDQDQYKHMLKLDIAHIDDVASAHIFLFECSSAKGRYICSSADITVYELFDILSAKYPEFQISLPNYLKNIKLEKKISLSSMKLLNCGFEFQYGVEEMLDDAIRCCKEKGFLSCIFQNTFSSEEKI